MTGLTIDDMYEFFDASANYLGEATFIWKKRKYGVKITSVPDNKRYNKRITFEKFMEMCNKAYSDDFKFKHHYPNTIDDILDDMDVVSMDIIVQMLIFDDVIYG